MAEPSGERTLVEVLRHEAIQQSDDELAELVDEAADEIERLREALEVIASDPMKAKDPHAARLAKAALTDSSDVRSGLTESNRTTGGSDG